MRNSFISTAIFLAWTVAASAETTHFDGVVSFRGDELPIRLTLNDFGDSTLDIPQLWYAGESISVTQEDEAIALELPFGIGAFTLTQGGNAWVGTREDFELRLDPGTPPPYSQIEMPSGAYAPAMGGTLYLPEGEGPFPAVIIVGGSSSAHRDQWAYRSKADYYARMGVAAFVYDRRSYEVPLEGGSLPSFWTHADDLVAIRDTLAANPAVAGDAIGLHAGSQGAWLSIIAQGEHSGFAFMVLTGVPAVSPGEQDIQMLVAGMRDDGLADEVIADAVAYRRLYFSVAHTLQGIDALLAAFGAGEGSAWIDYVDVPETIDDLNWWHRHQAYDPRAHLSEIDIPILAMTGADDWVTPPVENLPLLEHYAAEAGNEHVVTMTLPRADHRLERGFYTDDSVQWHWFEIASEAREAIPAFLREHVGLTLTE